MTQAAVTRITHQGAACFRMVPFRPLARRSRGSQPGPRCGSFPDNSRRCPVATPPSRRDSPASNVCPDYAGAALPPAFGLPVGKAWITGQTGMIPEKVSSEFAHFHATKIDVFWIVYG